MNYMEHVDDQYLNLMDSVLCNGVRKEGRNGATISLFGTRMRFKLQQGLPILTTKEVKYEQVLSELLWFISGSDRLTDLKKIDPNNKIWDANYEDFRDRNNNPDIGYMGNIYGVQWRKWEYHLEVPSGMGTSNKYIEIDQLQNVIDKLNKTPDDRRMIVSTWNVGDIEYDNMALPPCHAFFQFWTRDLTTPEMAMIWAENNKESNKWVFEDYQKMNLPTKALSCQLYQRSCDVPLGVPFNILSYSFLIHMIAKVVNMVPDEFIWVGGDTHIYANQIKSIQPQFKREPYPMATLKILGDQKTIDDFKMDDFVIENYKHHPFIKIPFSA